MGCDFNSKDSQFLAFTKNGYVVIYDLHKKRPNIVLSLCYSIQYFKFSRTDDYLILKEFSRAKREFKYL
jgi:hypothetical protein